MELTREQLDVIESNDRRILVKAGAGTGKTEILTRRIIRLIEEEPELSIKDMAIITFTNKATEELQSRLKKAFYKRWKEEQNSHQKVRFRYELESLNFAQISTIHKFCSSILENLGPYVDDDLVYSPAYKVHSDKLTITIDQTIERWIQGKNNENKVIEHLNIMPIHQLKEIVRKAYTTIRNKGLHIEDVLKGTKRTALLEADSSKKKLKLELIELLNAVSVNHHKFKYGSLDVDDLLEYCSKILKKRPDLCKDIQKKYKYIFIDEFQDTSLYQSEIVKLICDDSQESPSLFVVGDIKQSIYEFRGADTNAYNQIENWIRQNGSILTLSTNWRSTSELVHFVNLIFDQIKDNEKYQFKREDLIPSYEKDEIDLTKAYDWIMAEQSADEDELIAKYLKDKIDKGETPDQFTILVRKNCELEVIAEKLLKYSIPFTIVDSGNFFNQHEIIDMYRVLKSILNSEDLVSIQEACSSIFFENSTDIYNELVYEIETNQLIYNLTPSQLIDFIYKKTGILKRSNSQVRSNLNKLKEVTRKLVKNENITLYKYVNWLSGMIVSNVDEPLADSIGEMKGSVHLMTIHKAKGLEFPIVILPHLDQSISGDALNPEIIINQSFPSLEFLYKKYYENNTIIQSNFYEESISRVHFNVYSEELRVLYVALTRAKTKLVLVGSKKCKKGNICYQNWIKKD